MIYFLTTKRHDYTIRKCLRSVCTDLVGEIEPICYGRLFLTSRFPPATWVFSDIERLETGDRERAQRICDRLATTSGCRVLNSPLRSWRRFELLRTLYEQGVNQFNVYRLIDDPQPERFPVFVRGENDHKGARSTLIRSQRELEEFAAELDRTWRGRDGMIATEFCDVSDEDGVYRKYSAFRIGDRILPRHLFFAEQWCVKAWSRLDPELLAEERRYMTENPHADELMSIFHEANIEFGRVDYGVLNGRLQIWEINTNPMLPVDYGGGGESRQALHDQFRDDFVDAMRAIDANGEGEGLATGRREVPLWAALGIPWRAVSPRFKRSTYRRRAA